ncbi:MAG: hypothetical protein C0436_00630 [Alphaproteobacteria bacterium]|nr:hypothetical protein [Alphaproteobacteria bacterium]
MLKSILASLLAIPLCAGIPQDKAKHVVAGALIGGTVTWIAKENGSKHPEFWGIGAALLAGALKEAADRRHQGNRWDGRDITATAAGGIVISYTIRF